MKKNPKKQKSFVEACQGIAKQVQEEGRLFPEEVKVFQGLRNAGEIHGEGSMMMFLLYLKLYFWEEVHTDGHPTTEEIYEFFEGKNPLEARTKALRFIKSIIEGYPKNTAPSVWDHRAKLLRELEIEFIPIGPPHWSEKIQGEEGIAVFEKTLRDQLEKDEQKLQLMREGGYI